MIDFHSHHYPDIYLDAVREADSGLTHYVRDDGRIVVEQDGAISLAAPQPMPSAEERIAAMDAAGIRTQALSVSAPNVYRLPDSVRVPLASRLNDDLNQMAESKPGRFRVLASLPLPNVEASIAEIDRARGLSWFGGFFLCTTIDRRTLDTPDFEPVWRRLNQLGATVFVHPTTACCTDGIRDYALALGIDYMAETTLCISRLVYSGLFERYPAIRWVFAQLGGTVPFIIHRLDNYMGQFPECREHIDRKPSEILRGIHFDTVTSHPPALRCALDTFGAEQFVFGTDYPHVPGGLDPFVEILKGAGLSEAEFASIAHGKATELLGLSQA